MSLSYEDLQSIRKVIEENVEPIQGELGALRNDIKDVYEMIAELQNKPLSEVRASSNK